MKHINSKTLQKILLATLLGIFITFRGLAATHTINTSDFQFNPSSLTVQVGDSIKWVWNNGSHTTTSMTVPSGAAPWDFPVTSSNPTAIYVVTTPGTYAYKCTPHLSNGMTGSFTASGTSSISESGGDSRRLVFYPNPASDFLNIEIPNIKNKSVSVILSDILGNQVFRYSSDTASSLPSKRKIDMREFPSGIYFLSVIDEKGKYTYKIFKQQN